MTAAHGTAVPEDTPTPTPTPMDKLHADFLRHFDGLASRTLFIPWLDQGTLSTAELQALWATLNLSACPVVVINAHSLGRWVHPDHPLPEAFARLDGRSRADYLTCYLMHLYGGAVASLAAPRDAWMQAFDRLEHGVSLALRTRSLQGGHGLLAVRRNTPLTRKWFDAANAIAGAELPASGELDILFAQLLDRLVDEFRGDVIEDLKEL